MSRYLLVSGLQKPPSRLLERRHLAVLIASQQLPNVSNVGHVVIHDKDFVKRTRQYFISSQSTCFRWESRMQSLLSEKVSVRMYLTNHDSFFSTLQAFLVTGRGCKNLRLTHALPPIVFGCGLVVGFRVVGLKGC